MFVYKKKVYFCGVDRGSVFIVKSPTSAVLVVPRNSSVYPGFFLRSKAVSKKIFSWVTGVPHDPVRGCVTYGGICVLADATWPLILMTLAWRLNNDFSRSLRHCRWNFSSPVTEKIVLLHPKIHCLMRKGFALSTSSFSIPATPPSPHRIRSKHPLRGPFPYFCRHKKSSELWRIKETSCQRNSYPKQSRKTHPSTRISHKTCP